MKKRKVFQKLVVMILSAVMVMGAAPLSTAAQDLEAGEDSILDEAWMEPSVQEDDLLTAGAAMWVLEQLAAGAVSYIGGRAMDEAMGQMFGKPPNEIDTLINAFQEIKDELKNIQAEITNLSAKIDKLELRNKLNKYGTFINGYVAVYDKLCSSQKIYANRADLTTLFLMNLGLGKDENYKINGNTVIKATLDLGNELCGSPTDDYNVFGAFDKLDRLLNRWEHQGYSKRQAFQNNALYTYAMFSTMSQLACMSVIENTTGSDVVSEYIRTDAADWLNQLRENAVKVNKMRERCAVIKHPDLRIYRDTKLGVDLLAFRTKVEESVPIKTGSLKNEMREPKAYLFPRTRTNKLNREDFSNYYRLYSQQPSNTIYQRLSDDYKSDNGGKRILLEHIFYDKDKGAFTAPGEVVWVRVFPTNSYAFIKDGKSHGYWSNMQRTEYSVDNIKLEPHTIARVDVDDKGNHTNVYFSSDARWFSPILYYGTVNQGALKYAEEEPSTEPADKISGMESYYELPYTEYITLTVEEKPGYTYQWYVKTGDDGYQELPFANSTSYTLPPLVASMNGFQYICGYIPDDGVEENYLSTAPVTLNLVGEGVEVPETVHQVGSAEELETALEKVSGGEWDGHTIKLMAAIQYPKPITLIGRTLILDLNSYVLLVNPTADAEPNIDPMSSSPEIAAVYVRTDSSLTTTSGGALNIMAGDGIAYGVYAEGESSAEVDNIMSWGGGTAAHTSNNGYVTVSGFLQAGGDNSVGASCVDGGSIRVEGDVTVSGASSFGAYISSSNGKFSDTALGGNITVSGKNSRGAYLDAKDARLTVNGNVTVTNGLAGISASQGEVIVYGNVTAPDSTVNVRDGATVSIYGNAASTGKETVAVSSFGATLSIKGNVTSSGKGGTGILASAWDITDPALGAQVTIDGIISAATPLRIESRPTEESSRAEVTTKPDYFTFTDGINTVWAKSGSFEIRRPPTDDNSSSGGGGGSVTQPTIPAANGSVQVNYTSLNGTATLSLPTVKVNEIIEKSKGGEAVIDLSKVSGVTAASLPKDALTAFSKAGIDTTTKLPVGTVTLNDEAAASVAQQASGSNVTIELKQAAESSLTGEQKKSVKDGDLVLDINIYSDTTKITKFDGALTVHASYNGPQPVAVWYLNDKGELEKLNCTFKNGVVSFDLDHLSLYVVGQYTAKPAWKNPFTDVKEADWFYGAVSFCAEKGITNGTSATTFSPNATLTRGQFITMLLKAYGIEPVANPADNFADAGSTYYTGYLAAAKTKGISNGIGGNNFAPDKAITRQEMFTLLYNALKVLNKLPTADNGKTLADFTDSGSIATWATDAMTTLVKSGIISGSGSKLDPIGGSTRAQMAQLLYNLLGEYVTRDGSLSQEP